MKARSGPGFEEDQAFRLSHCATSSHIGYPVGAFQDYLSHAPGVTSALSAHVPTPGSVLGSTFGQLNLPTMDSISSYPESQSHSIPRSSDNHSVNHFSAEQFAAHAQANWEINYRNNLTLTK